jgi:dihydropteroate synthase
MTATPRKRFTWKLKERELQLGDRTLIVGILNVTPDSFSDSGHAFDPDRAFARALEMEEQGADVIDIGAESTRPGSARISEAEEKRRLIPVLKRLRGKLSAPISVDTYKAAVAESALELGAEIINDATGLTFDAGLAKAVSKHNAGLILNHMRGTPDTWAKLPPVPDVMGLIVHDLEATIHRAQRAAVERTRIVIDPGFGFGKRGEQNSEMLARLEELAALDLPILAGPSRKHFVKQKTERETEFATAAAVTAAILGGAHLVRVHDVEAMRAAAVVADAVVRSGRRE